MHNSSSGNTGGGIGNSLRDARIRKKIDIAQVEADTKIRAKYLRALENDEFNLIPGPAYVKSFLRTYAEYLGLDVYLLVEEYRAHHEVHAGVEQVGLGEPRSYARTKRARRVYRVSPALMVGAVALAVIVFLYLLGLLTGGGEQSKVVTQMQGTTATQAVQRSRGGPERRGSANAPRAHEPAARLQLKAKRSVWVCLIDAGGRHLIAGKALGAGSVRGPYRSKHFTATFGNGSIEVRVNGRREPVADSPNPHGYRITPKGVQSLNKRQRPTCT